ncbi:hypothetical protein [Dysgonomonas macrotermitis]|uniref:Uncharacterized protein n=1 Tax=Dysgonomonas macrotermitis TaxID=1346286 RepID=A0A1M4UP83_9BACT|nr:hypothetical protein [Dysgonomonas macrotermitis]SHE58465.1 hypothetical protein SAMN05444362_101658 [Dysgonomonas macrotermitis]
MKQQWDNLSKSIGETHKVIGDLFECMSEKKYDKAKKIIQEKWNRLIVLHNEFDKLVEPVKPIPIKIPFESPEFAEIWVFYKDYLSESHKSYLGSRHEAMILRRLVKLANKDEKQAIEMLEFFMANGYKSIFKPTEKQIQGEEPAKTETQDNSSFDSTVNAVDF